MIDTTLSDAAIALDVIRRLIGPDADPDKLIYFTSLGDPKAKMRARHTVRRGFVRTYTPQQTVDAQTGLADEFRHALGGVRFESPVAISAVFFRPNYQRIDADNLMKLVLDAGTQADAWVDDCYITAQSSYIELDRERPRSIIVLAPTTSSLDRSSRFTCQMCGVLFTRAGVAAFKNPPKFCTRECRRKAYDADLALARCPKCDTEFKRKTAGQRYCSRSCGQSSPLVRQSRANQRPPATCQTCGGRVSRREYIHCANCRPKGRPIGSKNKPKVALDV